MPRIPEEIIADIRLRADIVDIVGSYIQLSRRGGDFWGLCPFHHEKTPSFKVSPERQAFYCFGCKKSGNVFSFVEAMENVDFVGAAQLLAQRLGVHIPEEDWRQRGGDGGKSGGDNRAQGYELLAQLAAWYGEQLRIPAGRQAYAYCRERGLDDDSIKAFGIGYSPDTWDSAIRWGQARGFSQDLLIATGVTIQREEQPERCYDRFRNRLMFPINDELGRIVGFSARILVDDKKSPKYVNTPETAFFKKNRILYGLHLARHAFREAGGALVCEGQLDVIACHRAGLTHAVSAQGTAFTENHCQLLRRSTDSVVLAFDADTAGEKAAVRSVELLFEAGLTVKVVALPAGQDPDSIFREGGGEALRSVMAAQKQAIPFVLNLASRDRDMQTPQGRSQAVNDVLVVLSHVKDPVARAAHCQWLSQELMLPEEAILEAMTAVLAAKQRTLGRNRTPEKAERAAATPPPFVLNNVSEQVFLVLLDLALNNEEAAKKIQNELPSTRIPETAVGRALNIVLAHTADGEWELVPEILVADRELITIPGIARAINDPQFTRDNADNGRNQVAMAVDDCLRRVELAAVEQEIAENQQALQSTKDTAEERRLMEVFLELQKHKRELLSGRG